MAAQKLLYIVGAGAAEPALRRRLAAEGFDAKPSGRLAGGIHVRIRVGTDDEATVDRIVSEVAPDAARGPSGTPIYDFEGYREGR